MSERLEQAKALNKTVEAMNARVVSLRRGRRISRESFLLQKKLIDRMFWLTKVEHRFKDDNGPKAVDEALYRGIMGLGTCVVCDKEIDIDGYYCGRDCKRQADRLSSGEYGKQEDCFDVQ